MECSNLHCPSSQIAKGHSLLLFLGCLDLAVRFLHFALVCFLGNVGLLLDIGRGDMLLRAREFLQVGPGRFELPTKRTQAPLQLGCDSGRFWVVTVNPAVLGS